MSALAAYHAYEIAHASIAPARMASNALKSWSTSAAALFGRTSFTDHAAAAAEVFERATRRYGKPRFGIEHVTVDGKKTAVRERCVLSKPFCRLLRFERDHQLRSDPKVLVVAPMSGHHATLLRGTVDRLLERQDVYVTDWTDAREVPLSYGRFDLDDYVDYLIEMLSVLGPECHVMAVCQSAVPVLMAVSLMSEEDHPSTPKSMTLLGGPIDCRKSPTEVNRLATEKGFRWFEDNVISIVPWPHKGFGRRVYPGFMQLGGFISMNLDRHAKAYCDLYLDLSTGNERGADKHREFYDEYLAVMDMPAEYYLQTIRSVFVEHHLPEGRMLHRGRAVDPAAISRTAILTVEGGRDDITGLGQTQAAHGLCSGLPSFMKAHHVEPEAGHYGIFSGSRYRDSVAPLMEKFIRQAS